MSSFLLFNFPKAKIFLGDSGSYLTGFLIALNTIKTYELNSNISPFFYASILFYLFFEVFFSFTRKSLKRKSPLWPDNFHLHMLLFKQLKKTKKNYIANYTTGFLINFFYLILIIPSFYFQHHGIFSRYYFFFLMFLYIFSYNHLRKIK